MTSEQRSALIEAIADKTIEGMSLSEMAEFVYDSLCEAYDDLADRDLIEEGADMNLLEDLEIEP